MIWAAVTHLFSWCYGLLWPQVLGSIVVSIPVCHTGDRGSIPRQGVNCFILFVCSTAYMHANPWFQKPMPYPFSHRNSCCILTDYRFIIFCTALYCYNDMMFYNAILWHNVLCVLCVFVF